MLMLVAPLILLQAYGRASPLQPYETRSASGQWRLEVQPSDPTGNGPMRARILHLEEVTWSGDFPWTFENAGISDEGTCVGYSNGGELRVAVLDSMGVLRKAHEIEHTASVMHGPKLPHASGPVLVHSTADLALIRVQPANQSRPTPWRAYHLSTGEAAPDVVPTLPLPSAEEQGLYEGEAHVIGATELMLVHWWFADYDPVNLDWPQEGGVFALHDLQGRPVWTHALLDDYTDRSSEEEDDRLEAEVRRAGVIVSVGSGNRFVLHHVREEARVEYAVEAEDEGAGRWKVEEVSREPWNTPEPAGNGSAVQPIELVLEAKVALRPGALPPAHPIHDVIQLGFTEQGELELIRGEGRSGPSYACLSTDGELVFERDLSPSLPSREAAPQLFHELSGQRWLIQYLQGDPPWIALDARTGEVTPAPLPEGGFGSHVAPLADGGYLALVPRIVRSTAFTELYYVLADGSVGWQRGETGIGQDDTDFDRAVFFGQGIARTGQSTFAVLAMSELTHIDLERNVLETWSLPDLLGHDAGYMDGLLSDTKGGVLFEEGGAFQQVASDGTRTGSFVPKRGDGSRDAIMDHLLRVAPDGRLWTSDRQRVYRLDDTGVVDLVLGVEARDDELVQAGAVELDVLGRALVQDRMSRSVHVFDTEGRRLAICRLTPIERPEWSTAPCGGNRDGSVWAGPAKEARTSTRRGHACRRRRRRRWSPRNAEGPFRTSGSAALPSDAC